MTGRARTAAPLVVAALLASCGGLGAAEPDAPTATLLVTRDFGREVLVSEEDAPLPDDRSTVLRMLREHAEVKTSDEGFGPMIESIDGARQTSDDDSETTWALIVNGIEADLAPHQYTIHAGDVVQLDLRDWYVTLDVRATVGAFPEPFAHGTFGRPIRTELECVEASSAICGRVRRSLERAGVAVDGSRPPGRRPPKWEVQRARVLVGPWKALRERQWPAIIDTGARWSGVFAKFTRSADGIRLLDWDARTTRAVGAGSGLVAAERPTEADFLLVVTGVDEEGVERAARALDGDDLRGAFALVVTGDGPVKVPVPLANPDAPRDREGD